jgi:hypothetical protein
MNVIFTIASAYQWPAKNKAEKLNNSEKALKHIIEFTKNRFTNKTHKNGYEFKISYKRLRASAGANMLDSIIKRIENSQIIIVDISNPNPNVFLELGIALYVSKINNAISVYLIKEKTGKKLINDLPSDLHGFFISEYVATNGKIEFNDNNSLRMSIVSDINDFYSKLNINIPTTDEINFNP